MKSIFLTVLAVFTLFAFSTASDLLIGTEERIHADTKGLALTTSGRITTTRIPSKLVGVTSKLILYNLKMRPRFEDGTIEHSKYKKRVQALSRRAQRLSFKDLESDDDEESDDEEGLSVATRKAGKNTSKMPVVSRDACGRCRAACAGAAASCKVGCYFTGPAGVVECEVAWAVVSVGCFGVCAKQFC